MTAEIGSRLREKLLRIAFSFIEASVIAARKFLHVSGRSRGSPSG